MKNLHSRWRIVTAKSEKNLFVNVSSLRPVEVKGARIPSCLNIGTTIEYEKVKLNKEKQLCS